VQLAPEAKFAIERQLFGVPGPLGTKVKSAALVPPIWIPDPTKLCGLLSLFVRTDVITALVVPWVWGLKFKLLGDTLIGAMVGTTPAPVLKNPV
jgi:hypothetical protein